ncbi:MAG TPA: kelch repeat-containing protein [Usitatibacter sp.]|nr:kelch repeat-containing protein [Usitatibacter sp.]
MKTGCTLARFAALLAVLAAGLAANADTAPGCEGPNHYILSKCEHELRLEWMAVPDSLLAHGRGHAATLLEDGRVLVVGGGTWHIDPETWTRIRQRVGAEIYDPVSRTWSLTAPMSVPRMYGAHAVRLLDGRVMVLDGEELDNDLQGSVEIFDPASGAWTRTANLLIPRVSFTATLLESGEVLVAGGVDRTDATVAVAEIYNPESGTWRTTGSLHSARFGHTATILPDGRVLVAGGVLDDWIHEPAATGELFDPETGTWSPAGRITQGWAHTATSLGHGLVLVAGGTRTECPGGLRCSSPITAQSTRLYDAESGAWMDAGNMISRRYEHLAMAIPGHGVLLVGGVVDVAPAPQYRVASVERSELFEFATGTWKEVVPLNRLPTEARQYYSATRLADGTFLLIGDAEGKRAVQLSY